MKNECIEQVCVCGINVPQPIALVNLSEAATGMDKSNVEASLKATLDKVNKTLAGYQRVSTMIIDNEPWNEHNEILTPTLKVRRGKLDELYLNDYPDWHEDGSAIVWK